MFQSQTGSPSSSDEAITATKRQKSEFQSQTGSPSSSDSDNGCVWQYDSLPFQSQTGSPSSSDGILPPETLIPYEFQSQTGSPSSSDCDCERQAAQLCLCFNPKREAHPLQTLVVLSSCLRHEPVSIPNGKPI